MTHSRLDGRRWRLAALAGVVAAVTAACASGSASGSGTASPGTASPGSASPGSASPGSASPGSASPGSSGASDSAGISAALAAIAPYEGHPSAFPVTEPLAKRPARGSRFIYLQCSTPVCAQIGQLLAAPAKALGVTLSVINSGSSATSSQAAAAAALAQKPAAVLLPAVDPQLFGGALHQLDSAGIAVTGVGIIDGAPYGVQESAGGQASVERAGQLMADWVVAHVGAAANVVFFGSPELSFSIPMQTAFEATLRQNCPSCKVSYQQLSVETFGTTAPGDVVSYLQAHPSTNTVVFATMEGATGLAAALKDAGMHVTTLGFAPSPSNLQDIKNGGLTAGLGLDLPVQEWVQVDLAARQLAHQTIASSELNVDLEFLTKANVTSQDATLGWTGYPDMAQRFAKLWFPAS
jgi:ribose transport system substrate-binding protein